MEYRPVKKEILTPPIRISLLVDSTITSKYVYDLCDWAVKSNVIQIDHIIIQEKPMLNLSRVNKLYQIFRKRGWEEMLAEVTFSLLVKFEMKLLKRYTSHADHLDQFDLSALKIKTLTLTPKISKNALIHEFSDEDVEKVENLKLDVLVRCGSGILEGKILSSAKFGIVSFHHGDNRVNRGGPAGFWEIFLRQAKTGFTIQQLTRELDGGNVLMRGNFSTKRFFLLNQASLQLKSNFYMKLVLEKIAEGGALEFEESIPYYNPLYRKPKILVQVLYFYRTSLLNAGILLKRLRKRKEIWGVSFLRGNWHSLVMRKAIQIENPKNHFLADPFVLTVDHETFCFVEDFDLKQRKGSIAVYSLEDRKAKRIGNIIEENFHMSFPFVFKDGSQIYMCPESSANRDIRLYECIEFPKIWKLKSILMKDVDAADTVIVKYSDLWWLITNIDPVNTGDHSSEMFIFYSDDLFAQSWTPHQKNPIYIDPTKARNGGLVFDENSIYRVSQNYGFNTYGESSSINKVVELSESQFKEKSIVTLLANFYPKLVGTHSLNSDASFTVFDFLHK